MTNSEMFKAHKYIKDFESEIKRYSDSLKSIEQKVDLKIKIHYNCLVFECSRERWVHKIRNNKKKYNSESLFICV